MSNGYAVGYLLGPVQQGREGYYTGATACGEPAGVWHGQGAELLGLAGEVEPDMMEAVYGRFLDPRDEATRDRSRWGEAEMLGDGPRQYRSAADIYDGLLAGRPDAGPEERAELQRAAERMARQAVMFIDATFSAPKSVTVAAVAFERAQHDAEARAAEAQRAAERATDETGRAAWAARAAEAGQEAEAWGEKRAAVERAVLAGARAAIDHFEREAGATRVGHHGGGAGRWADGQGITAALFLQHDSRDRDPQLHVHCAMLNKVATGEGKWLTLDSRAIHRLRGAAGAIAERVMEAHLSRELGLRIETRPDGKAREVVGVPQAVMDLLSKRRHALTGRTERLIDEFRRTRGREPSQLERWHIHQQATLETRKGKSHGGETEQERLDRWEGEARTRLEGGLAQVARAAVAAGEDGPARPDRWSPADVIARALDRVGEHRQTWTRGDLLRAVSDCLPGRLGVAPDKVQGLLERLTDLALREAVPTVRGERHTPLPAELRRADGTSAYQEQQGQRYTSRSQVAAEEALLAAGVERGAAAVTPEQAAEIVARFARNGRELGPDQAAALRGVLTSSAYVEVMAAAAGSGKSFVVGSLAEAWAEHGHRTLGLAPSQVAARVLADLDAEGLNAMNLAGWRAAQARLDSGRARPEDHDLALRAGDLLVVDEAGMASTRDLAEVVTRARAAGAKVLLVGDARQLAAVGPGGALADVGQRAATYELVEVRRFSRGWEGEASLRLRNADPTALDQYDRHGHVRDGGTLEQAEAAAGRAWLADTLAGRESLLIVGTNEAATRVSAQMRAELVRLGRVQADGVPLGRDDTVAGVGDMVQARRNAWALEGYEGNERAPINRDTFRVVATTRDHGLVVTDQAGRQLVLPGSYVREHVSLAYACTVHGAQGRTVDTAHPVVEPSSSAAAVYVSMTRGRDGNTAWVVTRPTASDAPVGQVQEVKPRAAREVLGSVLERAVDNRGALAEAGQAAELEASELRHVDRLADGVAQATAGRTGQILDELVQAGSLSGSDRARLAADRSMAAVERLLRSAEIAGHDPRRVLGDALSRGDLADARSPAQVLHARMRHDVGDDTGIRTITSYRELIPAGMTDEWRTHLERLADAADDRRRELGGRIADDPPEWATKALGPVPADPVGRLEWEQRVSWAAAHRENMQTPPEQDAPLGASPPVGLAEKHTVWATAHRELGLPDVGPEEAGMTDGRLLARVAAHARDRVWAPRYVAEELAATAEQAANARTDATLWKARLDAGDNEHTVAMTDGERAELAERAAEAERAAAELAARHARLQEVDQARAQWYAHTATEREIHDRAVAALEARGIDPYAMPDRTTGPEWLAAHEEEQAEDEKTRPVRERDVDEVAEAGEELPPSADVDAVETGVPDLREVAEQDPTENKDAYRQVPDDATVDAAEVRAQTALVEIRNRHREDEAHGLDDTADEAVPWWAAGDDDEDDYDHDYGDTWERPEEPAHAGGRDAADDDGHGL